MKRPWQRLSSRVVAKNPYWNTFEDKVIQPNGKKGLYYRIEKPDFVVIIGLGNQRRDAMLVRQWRYVSNRYSWEFSMGTMNKNETPLSAAKREFEEETGLKARRWKKIGTGFLANSFCGQGFSVFVADNVYAGKQSLDPTEADLIVEQFSLPQIRRMIAKGIILDSPTITAMYFLDSYLKSKV